MITPVAQHRHGSSAGQPFESLRAYYAVPAVRKRIVEFLGGDRLDRATCQYLTADDATEARRVPRPVGELWDCLEHDFEIGRSLWDRESLIADLDLEYVNFDHPGEAYEDPERIFRLQAPVVEVIHQLLDECGIAALHVLSGRGHHFIWRIRMDSPVYEQLAEIGQGPPTLWEVNARAHPPHGERISRDLGAAFAGLGLVIEFLAHRVKAMAAPRCEIPVELTAVESSPGPRGREMISIDISGYGDPLAVRTVRVPFSVYYKPLQQHWPIDAGALRRWPRLFVLPLHGMSVGEGAEVMRDPERVAELAARADNRIPDQTAGTGELLARYRASPLAEFHRWFYSQKQHPAEDWPQTYDFTPMEPLPRCAQAFLNSPDDSLLHPSAMRHVTRVMLALGWHPRHIAGLICSRFARSEACRGQWGECDPATRADFYTRVFAGLFVAGGDDLIDFNCQSCQEQRTCPVADCSCDLEGFRQSALARRTYDQLAHRPFNRLFLPTQHP